MSNQHENIDIESLNPELIQKLYEFVNSENREELIQQISHNELIQFLQLADQLQKQQGDPLSKLLNQDISGKASPKSSTQELDSQQQM